MELNGVERKILNGLEDLMQGVFMQDKPRSHVFRHPPPDHIKKGKSNIRQRTDYKTSVGLMVPTRFVGVNFYIKGHHDTN